LLCCVGTPSQRRCDLVRPLNTSDAVPQTANLPDNSMLQEIHIQNYAVVEHLTVEFHPGLNVLTGETGSGKSLLVDALALVLGGRASPDVIRTGANRATVTAVFRAESVTRVVSNDEVGVPLPWSQWLERYGIGEAEERLCAPSSGRVSVARPRRARGLCLPRRDRRPAAAHGRRTPP
jgi:hypothetical protein